uniref:Uncharacterized protein n=1 Tax=Tanacetum cinerariifolium TaxID=118510 RepID=A0A6L2KXI4_TANCI|nr:hypothetical protein [Tanacetum cinerariifolium]
MDNGFLNRKTTSSKVVKNDLVVTRSVLGDLARKVKSIDGKILGKDGKPMMPRCCISNLDVLKESVREDVCLADVVVEQAPLTDDRSKLIDQQVGLDREAVNRLDLGPSNTMVNDTSCYTNVAPIKLNNSSKVILPMVAIDERIQLVLLILRVWKPKTLIQTERVSNVPLWVLMHNVPILAYSKVGLNLISAKVGRLIRLDAHTNFICLNSWGRSEYARALVEVSAKVPLVDSVDIDIPREDGKGYTTVTIRNNNKGKQVSTQCYIKGYRVNIPKTKLVYRAVVKPQAENNVACNLEQSSDTTKKPFPSDSSKEGKSTFINDDISLAELRSFVVKSANEESVLEYVGNNDINGCILGEEKGDKISTMKTNSSMEVLNEDSDMYVDEVFLPNDGTTFLSPSGGGGQPLEEDDYDAYEDQFDDYPGLFQDFCDQFDFKVKGIGRK